MSYPSGQPFQIGQHGFGQRQIPSSQRVEGFLGCMAQVAERQELMLTQAISTEGGLCHRRMCGRLEWRCNGWLKKPQSG